MEISYILQILLQNGFLLLLSNYMERKLRSIYEDVDGWSASRGRTQHVHIHTLFFLKKIAGASILLSISALPYSLSVGHLFGGTNISLILRVLHLSSGGVLQAS